MKNKKGFTLIELLAVILILGIIALIAIPTVTSVIKESKKGAFNATVGNVVKAIELECQMEQMRGEDLTTTYNFADGKLDQNLDINGGLPKSGIITVDEACRTTVNVSDGTFIAKKAADSDKIIITEKKKPEAYSLGDYVVLNDGTTWMVLKDSPKNEEEVKLVSTQIIRTNLTTETGKKMFYTNRSYREADIAIEYDSNPNGSVLWETSSLKSYLDGTVKTRLEASLNTAIKDITIWGIEELTALGCAIEGNEVEGYYYSYNVGDYGCDMTKKWYRREMDLPQSWTKVKYERHDHPESTSLLVLYPEMYDETTYWNISNVRPIITVSKSVIEKNESNEKKGKAYYAFGEPTTKSSTNYQDVIDSSGSNVFVKLEEGQLSVCVYDNKLLCFRNNNYTQEGEDLANAFNIKPEIYTECDDDCGIEITRLKNYLTLSDSNAIRLTNDGSVSINYIANDEYASCFIGADDSVSCEYGKF